MEVKPGYKQTEVGVIPEDWEVEALGALAVIERGKFSARPRNDPKYYGGDIPFLQTGDVTRSGGKISSFSQTLNSEGLAVSRLFPSRTLFFTIAANIGDVGIADFASACPDSLVAISPKLPTEKMWLLYVLAHRKGDFATLASPGAQLNINLSKLRPYLLPVPTLPEQRAIAAALSDVDALLDGLDRLIAKKRDLKQAAMQQLLTGQTRLPGFTGEWEVKRFCELTSPSHSRIDPSRCVLHNFCVELEHIDQGSGSLLGWTETKRSSSLKTTFDSGDVLFGKLRAYLRKYWLASREGVCSTEIWVLSPNEDIVTSGYLYQIVQMDWFIEAASTAYGTHMPRSDWKVVKELELRVPPVREQAAIATVLSDMDAEIAALEQRRAKTKDIKQAMMQELLTGKTRLI